MASFHSYETASGETRWRVAWRVGRKQRSKRGFRTKRQASRWWLDNGAELEGGGQAATPTVAELWPLVLDRHKTWKTSTVHRREQLYRLYIADRWGSVRVGSITYLDVQSWAEELAPKFTDTGTPSQIVTCLRMCIEEARRAGYVDANPCAGVIVSATRAKKGAEDASGEDQSDAEKNTLTQAQIDLIVDQLTVPVYKDAIRLLAACGMRWGEMAGLRAEDVDLQAQTITIRRTVSHIGPGTNPVRRPKTGKIRVIALPDRVVDMMARRVSDYPEGWLFPSPRSGSYLSTPGAKAWFGAAVAAARKIDPTIPEGFHPHSLRHTAVSRWIAEGVPITTIAAQVGHASITTTQQIYSHVMPGAIDELKKL